jgi:hypothetical protein
MGSTMSRFPCLRVIASSPGSSKFISGRVRVVGEVPTIIQVGKPSHLNDAVPEVPRVVGGLAGGEAYIHVNIELTD